MAAVRRRSWPGRSPGADRGGGRAGAARRRQPQLAAAIFAEDLLAGCRRVFDRLAEPGATTLSLPITIPLDEDGMVVLGTGPPQAPRHPGTLELTRSPGPDVTIRLARDSLQPLSLPGVDDDGSPAQVTVLMVTVTPRGLVINAYGRDGTQPELSFSEHTARQIANALLITIGVKLAKADRQEDASG